MRVFYLLLLFFVCSEAASAQSFVPADDDVILERVAARGAGSAPFPAAVPVRPANLDDAVAYAKQAIENGRATGDTRQFGYALATLGPWLSQSPMPHSVRVLHAILLQQNHQFREALDELNVALKEQPLDAQSWITKAFVQLVIGEISEAKKSCLKLLGRVDELSVAACLTAVRSVSGDAEHSYDSLARMLVHLPAVDRRSELWTRSLLGEIAERLGRSAEAEAHFEKAITLDPTDTFLLCAYGDFLIASGKHQRAAELLGKRQDQEGILIRYAIALGALGRSAELDRTVDNISQSIAAQRRRGDAAHLREEAMFLLDVRHDQQQAVRVAFANWQIQKEPVDTLLLARAASQAGDLDALARVKEWVLKTGLEDVRLNLLLDGLK